MALLLATMAGKMVYYYSILNIPICQTGLRNIVDKCFTYMLLPTGEAFALFSPNFVNVLTFQHFALLLTLYKVSEPQDKQTKCIIRNNKIMAQITQNL